MSGFGIREQYNRLLAQKEALEIEAEAITSELTSNGLNGQPPAGVKGPLTDSEGFPRADIDIYNVKSKRQRLSVINTDHRSVMKAIEELLPKLYELNALTVTSAPACESKQTILSVKLPIARINEILAGSPAFEAGLLDGDYLIQFGRLVYSPDRDVFNEIPKVVGASTGTSIPIIVKRNSVEVSLTLTPKQWHGRGLLGCHLLPI